MPHIESIHIAPSAGAPMQSLTDVEAVAGEGLAADRYLLKTGFYSARPTDPGAREVTLFEAETLEALEAETGIALAQNEHRRNLTTRGIALTPLIGQRFRIGDVLLEGVKDCPPCEHLDQVTGKAVLKPLLNRAGIRARVVESGVMRVGDTIALEPALASTV